MTKSRNCLVKINFFQKFQGLTLLYGKMGHFKPILSPFHYFFSWVTYKVFERLNFKKLDPVLICPHWFFSPFLGFSWSLLLIISWSENYPLYAIFGGLSVGSFWDTPSQNRRPNSWARAEIRFNDFEFKFSSNFQGAKRGPFWPIQVLPMVLGDDPRWS